MTAARRFALITGASEGIGWEFAKIFAANGHDLAICARRGDLLEILADEIAASGRPRPLVVVQDLSQPEGCARLMETVRQAGVVDILVNNAGFGLNGAFSELDRGGQLNMIDLNVRALCDLTARCLPDITRNGGKILNVASIAAFAPGPGMAVYYATKAFVLSFSEALYEELKLEGVVVTALCPGPILTGFQSRAKISPSMTPQFMQVSAHQAAKIGYDALMAGRRVVTPGLPSKIFAGLLAQIPHRLLLPRLRSMQMARNGASEVKGSD